jgi:branched-chain amino acid transport system substrate-binding protein
MVLQPKPCEIIGLHRGVADTKHRTFIAIIVSLAILGGASSSSRAQSATPIKIGISISLTGGLAEAVKPTGLADQLWEKEVNARGGLLGRKVVLTLMDNKSNPESGVSIYERLLDGGNDFIFEDGGSLMVQRESTVAEQHKKLFLSPNGSATSLYQRGYQYLFYTGPAMAEDLYVGLVRLLQSLPPAQRPKTVGYVTVQNIAYAAVAKGTQGMLKPLDLKTLVDVSYSPTISDAAPLVANLKQQEPDLVFQTGLSSDTLSFIRNATQQNLNYKLMVISMTSAAQPNFESMLGDSINGMAYCIGWTPELKSSKNAQFIQAYRTAYGFAPTYNAAQGYARWQILEQAINATQTLDQEKLRVYIAHHEFETVVGTIKYNDQGFMKPPDTIVVQFQQGKRVIVWPSDQATGTLKYPHGAQ